MTHPARTRDLRRVRPLAASEHVALTTIRDHHCAPSCEVCLVYYEPELVADLCDAAQTAQHDPLWRAAYWCEGRIALGTPEW